MFLHTDLSQFAGERCIPQPRNCIYKITSFLQIPIEILIFFITEFAPIVSANPKSFVQTRRKTFTTYIFFKASARSWGLYWDAVSETDQSPEIQLCSPLSYLCYLVCRPTLDLQMSCPENGPFSRARNGDLHPARLHSSVGRASHWYRRGHGFESRWSLGFICNCKKTYFTTAKISLTSIL